MPQEHQNTISKQVITARSAMDRCLTFTKVDEELKKNIERLNQAMIQVGNVYPDLYTWVMSIVVDTEQLTHHAEDVCKGSDTSQ